jgi:predicted AAA+ superfamily ATPase
VGYRNADIAGALENVVYLELLRRGYTVSIGKQDTKEVDFIGVLRDERLYVQVSYLLADEKVIEREFGPLRAINDNYEKVVLSMDSLFDSNIDGIKRKNIVDFLLEL